MASSSAPSSSSSRGWKYDVFLSFRGEDTRKTFVDHLYFALEQKTIRTYKDDVTLDRGDTIAPSLLKAIESSQILVIIFSENYADSSWCLDELSHIMKCRENSETGQLVMPIFYNVDPSEVRKQKGKYGEAFAKHELSENGGNKVELWKKALVDASNIAGWEPKHFANGHEAKCIKEIVGFIFDKLSSSDSTVVDKNLVGMRVRLELLKSQLRIGSCGVRMVGIWGIGGGGKTTLATFLYKKFSPNFDGCCFLGNIREQTQKHGLQSIQEKLLSTVFKKKMQVESVELGKDNIKQMLCRRKVLIVLDDVDHLDQLKALAGCRTWFGDGSRIIITTRDERVLTTVNEIEVSPINLLSHKEAVRLFNKHAYNKNKPVEDYKKLSQQVVTYAAGLPLALIVLGSFLHDTNKDEWLSTLARLKDHPDMNIVEKLKISYDGLKDVEKELFLDIACFHRSESKDKATKILDACGFYPNIGVKVLIQKALIVVSSEGCFDMHDLVQEMGHYIVRGKHPNNPEKHSRIWQKEDVKDILSRNATMENDMIEAISCDVSDSSSSSFIMLVSKMKKLRFLQIKELVRNYQSATTENDDNVCCLCSSSLTMPALKMKEPSFLSNELRYIHWSGSPASLFPVSFQPTTQLVVLKLEESLHKEIWKGHKNLPCLKELELSWMKALVRTPDFGGLPCLQKLTLKGCESLKEIHQSLGNHNRLVEVCVKKCYKLTRFPRIDQMEKLETLEISQCIALLRTPNFGGLPCLQKLTVNECESLKEIHQSLGNHNSLVHVCVNKCKKITRFPSIVRMDKLQILEIKECLALDEFPKIEAKMDSLIELTLSTVMIKVLPSSVGEYCTNLISLRLSYCQLLKSIEGKFHALRKLNLSGCKLKDGEIPKVVGELSSLRELHLSWNDFTRLDFSLSRLTSLKLLELNYCRNLVELPELPSSLAVLWANNCHSLEAIVRDDIPINCKCLCHVSICNPIDGLKLKQAFETSFQRVTGRCISLEINDDGTLQLNDGSAIATVSEPHEPHEPHAGRKNIIGLERLLETMHQAKLHLPYPYEFNYPRHNDGSAIATVSEPHEPHEPHAGRKNIIGLERLLETMLQGISIESGSLELQGLQILRVFEPRLFRGDRCRMELPENWHNDFSGFLFCTASYGDVPPFIRMKKHDVYLENSDDDDDKSVTVDRLEESDESKYTWVGYLPFGSLTNTVWWRRHTSSTAAIQFQFDKFDGINGCGCKLIRKRNETTTSIPHSDSSYDVSDDYSCQLYIIRDSKSTLDFLIDKPFN